MKNTLITGVTGQDGSCLAEFLLEKDYRPTSPQWLNQLYGTRGNR